MLLLPHLFEIFGPERTYIIIKLFYIILLPLVRIGLYNIQATDEERSVCDEQHAVQGVTAAIHNVPTDMRESPVGSKGLEEQEPRRLLRFRFRLSQQPNGTGFLPVLKTIK